MKKLIICLVIIIVLMAIVSISIKVAHAQERVTYTITRSVIASGGSGARSGDLSVYSTLGQPMTGSSSGGGRLYLTSGFWNRIQSVIDWIQNYLPIVFH